jgi:NADPH2:quinone reductase
MPRAVRFDRYGGTEVLYLADVEMPSAATGEVVVEVRAAGINPGEISIREGYLDSVFPTEFPSGEGSDLAGVVSAVGEGVTAFSVGDEVMGWSSRRSSHAEYTAVPIDQLIHKTGGLSWPVAGSLYVVGVTAYAAVRAVSPSKGETVVVSAAAGGVGSVVVQLLRVKGAEVIGIASDANHAWLTSKGIRPVSYGDAAQEYGVKAEGSSTSSTTDVLAEMAELVASGQIEVPIAATYRLDEVQQAYTELAQRHTRGKIVLIP